MFPWWIVNGSGLCLNSSLYTHASRKPDWKRFISVITRFTGTNRNTFTVKKLFLKEALKLSCQVGKTSLVCVIASIERLAEKVRMHWSSTPFCFPTTYHLLNMINYTKLEYQMCANGNALSFWPRSSPINIWYIGPGNVRKSYSCLDEPWGPLLSNREKKSTAWPWLWPNCSALACLSHFTDLFLKMSNMSSEETVFSFYCWDVFKSLFSPY